MNVITRGVKNALRSPMRSGAIVLMLAISIGLILSMLVARTSVQTKIAEIKATTGTTITISPAGIRGGMGGGDPLTSDQIKQVAETSHIASTVETLTDQLGTDDTNLTPSLELGSFGQRQQRFESSSNDFSPPESTDKSTDGENSSRPTPQPRTTVTGTTAPDSAATDGGTLTISSGKTIDGHSSAYIALIGKDLAEKNSLTIDDTFTAYEKTFTVTGIYSTGNTFSDSGIIIPLKTLQTLTDQADAVTSIVATVDSSDNVKATVSALESSLGDDADVTSDLEAAEATVSSLKSISSLALAGVIGSAVAGAFIILLAMILVVRERRREIGVMKAIGGTNGRVVGQFIAESLTLTTIGMLAGLVFGILVSGPLTNSLVTNSETSQTQENRQQAGRPSGFSGMPQGGPGQAIRGGFNQIGRGASEVTASLTPASFLGAIGITVLLSVVGSSIAAWSIARVRPAEVLRAD